MKISTWTKKQSGNHAGIMVAVSHVEAIALIKSLADQLSDHVGRGQRLESFDEAGTYFSVAVTSDHPAAEEVKRLRKALEVEGGFAVRDVARRERIVREINEDTVDLP